MAVQFDVAYSDLVTGAGIIAGGPYGCSQGRLDTATAVCSCTGLLPCNIKPGGTHPAALAATAATYEKQGGIAPLANLARHRIWLFSGAADTLVPRPVMDDLQAWYSRYTTLIAYRRDLPAQHAMPTDRYGNACGDLGTPYINNCGFDAAGALLQWIYPGLVPRSTAPDAGRMIEFDQSEFLADPEAHGMALRGYLYVPRDCEASHGRGCRLHIAFHGCQQNWANVGDQFIRHAGYNAWADSNRLLVLYPQTAAIYPLANPNACWDWFSYDDPAYARRQGRQMAAIKRMVDRLTRHQ
ncbi:PHA-depolymerase-like protein [Duganella sp. FT92W]|uniref:PHA-depolymerase-like protein n=2 Tax=Pseudoduganella rivuli TaxID=2666085 RepID=A0A7X2LSF9_9BURK|nr:PHA-depolymerase-like protein [Pseudoduganella rivuli]